MVPLPFFSKTVDSPNDLDVLFESDMVLLSIGTRLAPTGSHAPRTTMFDPAGAPTPATGALAPPTDTPNTS
jgi:hypothetical protein